MKTFRQLSAAGAALLLVGALVALPSVAYATDEAPDSSVTAEVTPTPEPTSEPIADPSPAPSPTEKAKAEEDEVVEVPVVDPPAADVSDNSSETDAGTPDTTDSSSPAPTEGTEEGKAPVVDAPVVETPVAEVVQPQVEAAPIVVTPSAPLDNGNDTVFILTKQGVIYTDMDGNVLTGTVPIPKSGLTVRAIPAEGYVFPEGARTEWVFKQRPPLGTPLVSISDPVVDTATPLQVTVSFSYTLVLNDPSTTKFIVEVYDNDGAEVYSYQTNTDTDGTYRETINLVPGSYTLEVTGFNECGADCADFATLYSGAFIVAGLPILIDPDWPVQNGNTVVFDGPEGVIYTDPDGNVLTGTVPVPKGGLDVVRTPAPGYVFPGGTDTEKTYQYVPPKPITVTPQKPDQNGNTVTIPVQPGVIYTDPDGNVLTGTVPVPKGGLPVKATPAPGYQFPDGVKTEWKFEYTPEPPVTIVAPKPDQNGNTVTIPTVPGVEYFDVDTDEVLTGDVTIPNGGTRVIDVRPTGNNPVTGGPWSYHYQAPVSPTPSPVPTPTVPATPAVTPLANSVKSTGGQDDGSSLAVTGSDASQAGVLAGMAGLLVASGLVLMAVRRQRA